MDALPGTIDPALVSAHGGLLPQVSQLYARDPRRALVESMLATGQKSLDQPTYSPGAALAKALTIGLGQISGGMLNNDYEKMNSGALKTMSDASNAMLGSPGEPGPDGAQGQPTAPDPNRAARILAGNPITMPMALQQGMGMAQLRMKQIAEQDAEFLKQNKRPVRDSQGNLLALVPLTGAAETTADLERAKSKAEQSGKNEADLAQKPALEGAVESAKSAATYPWDIAKANNAPQRIEPGTTVNINPNRVPAPGTAPQPANVSSFDYGPIEQKYPNVPKGLLSAVAQVESSNGANQGPSSAGARGIFQWMPDTAKQYGVKIGDPASEAEGAGHYLSDLIAKNNGDVTAALKQYGGFVSKDPGAYLGKVAAAMRGPQAATSAQPVGQPSPGGVTTRPDNAGGLNIESGALPQRVAEPLINADRQEVAKDREKAIAANEDRGNLQAIADLMDRTKTGWTAETKLEAARILKGLGVPDDKLQQLTDTNVADSQALSKLFTINSAAAVRTMGAREPGSVIMLFKNAYQNLGTDPEAVKFMTNAQYMDRLRQGSLADKKTGYLTDSVDQYQSGGKYRGLNGFNEAFEKSDAPENYLHAAEAMSGGRFSPWGKITDPAQQAAIVSLIPKGRTFTGPDGQLYVRK